MQTITDGTAKFVIRNKRMQALIDMFYPVGTVYATTASTKPEFMNYGKWEEVSKGRVLQGVNNGENAGATKEAGLPNLKGYIQLGVSRGEHNGVFYMENRHQVDTVLRGDAEAPTILMDASRYNHIYGNSDTVQPPTYLVHFYRRVS